MTEKLLEEPQFYMRKWYYTREEIEDFSPSRKDGISFEKESELRKLYCSFLQELGMKLNLSQVTVACAMMLCHRFYMRQSHAKNDWQTIATVSIFLGSKIEETKCMLGDVAVMSYVIMYKWDASAPQRIKQRRDVYYKQKELILTGERLLLATIAFDFEIQLPYKPLVAALRRLDLFRDLAKVAWNFVNDWLCTTLCLQYKPHYIAAGSMFLAAKFQKVKLPSNKEKSWWLEFDISPMQLEVVIREMLKLLEQDRKQTLPRRHEKVTQPTAPPENTNIKSPQSCISDGCIASRPSNDGARAENDRDSKSLAGGGKHISVEEELPCQTGNSTSSSVVEDGESSSQPRTAESDHKPAYNMTSVNNIHSKIDANRIKEALKRRKREGAANKKLIEAVDPELDSDEAWIEKELENGIELESASSKKKQARYCEVLTH